MLDDAANALLIDPNLNLAGDDDKKQKTPQTAPLIQYHNPTASKSFSTSLSIFFSSTANMGVAVATWSVAKNYIPRLITANQYLKGNLGSIAMAMSGTALNSISDRTLDYMTHTQAAPFTWSDAAATLAAVGIVGVTASFIPLSGFAYALTMGALEPIAVRYTKQALTECGQRLFNKCNKRGEEPYQQLQTAPTPTASI